MYVNRITTIKEDINIYTNVNFIFADLKYNVDIILEVVIILSLIFIKTIIDFL